MEVGEKSGPDRGWKAAAGAWRGEGRDDLNAYCHSHAHS